MQKNWNFKETVPVGERPPFFSPGFHVAVIQRVEDDKLRDGETTPRAFYLYLVPHPQFRDPNCPANAQFRDRIGYDDKNGFTMATLMAILDLTAEQLQAQQMTFDPCSPTGPLWGRTVYIDARPQSRLDRDNPEKKYDGVVYYSRKAWEEERAKAAQAAQTAQAQVTAAASVQLPGQSTTVQAAPAIQPAPVAGTVPGIPGLAAPPPLS